MDITYLVILSIFLPMISGFLAHYITKIPRFGVSLARSSCILVSYLELILVIFLAISVTSSPAYLPFLNIHSMFGSFPVGFYIDYLALIPALLSSLFTALTLTYNLSYTSPKNKAYKAQSYFNRSFSFILIFNGVMLGTLFSDNLLMVIFFWEMISLCSYVLISTRNQDSICAFAAKKSLIFTHFGGFMLFLATVMLYTLTGTLSMTEIRSATSVDIWLFALILVACLPKTVLFPFHTWLPDGTVAPSPATVLFHVCGFQSGIYIILRFFGDLFYLQIITSAKMPFAPFFGDITALGFIISVIGAITLILGGLNGLKETDFKKIIAYSTISQLGYIVMMAGFLTPLSILSCIFHMISHALFCSLLFLCAGAVLYATGIHDITKFRQLYKKMPNTSKCCLIGIFSLASMPLLADFASKYLIFHSIMEINSLFFLIISIVGCILNTVIAIRVFYMVYLQNGHEAKKRGVLNGSPDDYAIKDPPNKMLVPMVVVIVLLIIVGIFPFLPLQYLVQIALNQINLQPVLFVDFVLVQTAYGFWNPTFILMTIGIILGILAILRKLSKSSKIPGQKSSEISSQLFICGEAESSVISIQQNYLSYLLSDILKIEQICAYLDVDRLYYAISAWFTRQCEKLLQIRIQYKFRMQIFIFLGAIIIILTTFLWI